MEHENKIFRRIFADISCLLTGGELGCESDIWFTVTGRGRDIVRPVKKVDGQLSHNSDDFVGVKITSFS